MTLNGVLLRAVICCGALGGLVAVITKKPMVLVASVVTGVAIATLAYTGWLPLTCAVLIGSVMAYEIAKSEPCEPSQKHTKTAILLGAVAGAVFVYCPFDRTNWIQRAYSIF